MEGKINEAAYYASDDSSAGSLDDLSEENFPSKVTCHTTVVFFNIPPYCHSHLYHCDQK